MTWYRRACCETETYDWGVPTPHAEGCPIAQEARERRAKEKAAREAWLADPVNRPFYRSKEHTDRFTSRTKDPAYVDHWIDRDDDLFPEDVT